ncbi:MAG: hypothetical protein AAF515_10315 [Pseudomonadota bacterium]
MTILKWLVGLLVAVAVLIALVFGGARFADGPLALVPGGPLQSGELRATPADWSFAADVEEIEFESGGRSRTVWIVADGGDGFIPASALFPPMKTWHKEALTEPAAMVRIDGVRYPINLRRIQPDSPRFGVVLQRLQAKYTLPPGSEDVDPAEAVWVFALDARAL